MKITKKKTYLALSGLTLAAVGSYISFEPVAYLNQFEISVPENVNFYSDLRSMGGSLLIFGLIALVGSLSKRIEDAAIMTSVSIFAAYGLFRLAAISIDGIPSNAILGAATIEIVFALIGFGFLSTQNKKVLA